MVPRRVIDDNGSGHHLVSSRCKHRVIMLTPVYKYCNRGAIRIVVLYFAMDICVHVHTCNKKKNRFHVMSGLATKVCYFELRRDMV